MGRFLTALLALGVASAWACGSNGTGSPGTVGVPVVGGRENPPPGSDSPGSMTESPGTPGDPPGASGAGCAPCSGDLVCDVSGSQSETVSLHVIQDGSGCALDVGGLNIILACGGAITVQPACTVMGNGSSGTVETCSPPETVGTWRQAGGDVVLCADKGCTTCTRTDAGPIPLPPSGGRAFDGGQGG